MIRKSAAELKAIETELFQKYPLLKQPGICKPGKFGRTMLETGQVLALFCEPDDEQHILGVAFRLISKILPITLSNEKLKPADKPDIINQYFDFVQLVLRHHSDRIEGFYETNTELFAEKRIEALKCFANRYDSDKVCWMEYAYRLIGRREALLENDSELVLYADKAQHYLFEAEKFLKKAHEAGCVEATEALATLTYVDKGQREEAIALWEQAASLGNAKAIQNLATVVMEDDQFSEDEKRQTLRSIWAGISVNKQETVKVASALKRAGLTRPVPAEMSLIPA